MKQIKQIDGDGPASSVVVFIGTHMDLMDENDTITIFESIKQAFPKHKYPAFAGDILGISNKTNVGIKQIKDQLLQLVEQPALYLSVENSWIQFQQFINTSVSNGLGYIDYSQFCKYATQCSIESDKINIATEFLVKVGTLLRIQLHPPGTAPGKEDDELDVVFFNPNWLSGLVSKLMNASDSYVEMGYFECANFNKIFSGQSVDTQRILESLLEKYLIIHRIDNQNKYVIPSLLLPRRRNDIFFNLFPKYMSAEQSSFARYFVFSNLALDLFGRLIVAILSIPGSVEKLTWNGGLLVQFTKTLINNHEHASFEAVPHPILFASYEFPDSLKLILRFPEESRHLAEKLWRILLESVKTLFESFYSRLAETTVEFIPCIHCLKKGKHDQPFLFSYSECIHAVDNGIELLYCSHIRSPSRCVLLSNLAPDIYLADLPSIDKSLLSEDTFIATGAFGVVYKGSFFLFLSLSLPSLLFSFLPSPFLLPISSSSSSLPLLSIPFPSFSLLLSSFFLYLHLPPPCLSSLPFPSLLLSSFLLPSLFSLSLPLLPSLPPPSFFLLLLPSSSFYSLFLISVASLSFLSPLVSVIHPRKVFVMCDDHPSLPPYQFLSISLPFLFPFHLPI